MHHELIPIVQESIDDNGGSKEHVGFAAISTRVLISCKVVGNPKPNPTRMEWIKSRSKYQKDRSVREIIPTTGKKLVPVDATTNQITTSNTSEAFNDEDDNNVY